ncbi:MAG: hypothetical protein RIQ33_2145 [Bacteroidota bacterium]|jgi:hypothetical protein
MKNQNHLNKIMLVLALIFCSTLAIFAQNPTTNPADGDYPANALPGRCYAKCYLPDQFEMQATQVVDKPASVRFINIPAVYETVVDTIMVKDKSIKYEIVQAVYGEISDTIQLSSATTRWVKGKADPSCLSDNPDNCRVMCLEIVPAQFKVQSRKIVASPAYTKSIEIPAEYKYVQRTVLKTPATRQEIEVPATFKTINQNVLIKKGSFGEWREILCASKITEAKILQIQQALTARGYNPGPVDNVFGGQTKAAIIQFQKDNHLPEGNLNMETLSALGLN